MAQKKQKKSTVDLIAQDIERVAKIQAIPPYAVTKPIYFAHGKYNEWDLRKHGGLINIRNTYFQAEEDQDILAVSSTADLRKQYNLIRKKIGDIETFKKDVEDLVKEMPKLNLKPYLAKKIASNKSDPRTLNLVLSDLHIGSDLTMEQHDKTFGPLEEARALSCIVKNVCNYKLEYRDQTELVVNILGDVIENQLHGSNSADLLHIQTCRAMWLLSQAIGRFSENFPKVTVNFAVGNHGRDTSIHPKRATDMKFNSLETTIYYGVKMGCNKLKNVKFNQPKTPWISYRAQGHKVYATHGDTHLNPGNPGKKVDILSLENQTNKINASLFNNEEYKVFVVGHVHQALVTALPNGSTMIVNGALTPPNSFAQTLNIMEAQQVQVVWETTPSFPVGDFRFINVMGSDKDATLDKIIIPFTNVDEI